MNTAARKIQKAFRSHLGKKAAFMRTMGYNKAMRSLIGNFPRQEGKNNLYKRTALFRRHLFDAMRPIKSGKELYRGLSGQNAKNFYKLVLRPGRKNFNTNSFSSFTKNINTARNFAGGGVVLVIKPYGGLPVLNYTNKRRNLRSMYPTEDEVLLPPGKFTIIGKGSNLFEYIVQFTPSKQLPNIKKETLTRVKSTNYGDNVNINEMNNYWKRNKTFLNAPNIKNHPNILKKFLNRLPVNHPIFKRRPEYLKMRV
jgi:hypothetical protein